MTPMVANPLPVYIEVRLTMVVTRLFVASLYNGDVISSVIFRYRCSDFKANLTLLLEFVWELVFVYSCVLMVLAKKNKKKPLFINSSKAASSFNSAVSVALLSVI